MKSWVCLVGVWAACGSPNEPTPQPPVAPSVQQPEPDPDRDLIATRCDQCPNEPELYNGIDDHDGCPDRAAVRAADAFGPWGIGFAHGTRTPEGSLRAIADIIAQDFVASWQAIELTGCAADDEPAALRADRIDVVFAELVKVGVDPAFITIVSEPCPDGDRFPHRRWVSGRPAVHAPTVIGCPPARAPQVLGPRVPANTNGGRCKATECWLTDEKRCAVPNGPLDGGVCGEPGGTCTRCRCLAPSTPIDTDAGPRPIIDLRAGDRVRSLDHGRVRYVPIARVHATPVTAHRVVELTLDDGSLLLVSPGHLVGDGRDVAIIGRGDRIGARTVVSAREIAYPLAATYDILPDSDSGLYYSGDAPLRSTLRPAK